MINMENKLMTEVATRRPNRSTSDKDRRTTMRAMRAGQFSGYEGLKLVDLPKPTVSDGKVLLRMTAAGVTPLDHNSQSRLHLGDSSRNRRQGLRQSLVNRGLMSVL